MAKSDLGKYMTPSARSFLRAQQPRINVPQRRATIDPTLFTGRAAAGAPLASRPVAPSEGGPALPSPQEYNPIIDAESGEDPNAPRAAVETQQPIESRGSSARYMIQGGGPRIDLSFLVPERANPNYDPNKAIGGENVPYLESKGVGGFFRRLLGDESNRMNIEAQQAQGAEWREAEKEAQKEERLLKRMQEANRPIQERFEKELKYRQDKDIREEIAREDALNLQLAREGEKDILSDIDMARKEARDAEERALRTRELDIKEAALKPPRYNPIGNTGLFQTPEGELAVFEPEVMRISDAMPGRKAGFRMLTGEGSKAPKRSTDGAQVDRATGAVLGGGPLPPGGGAMAPSGTATTMGAAQPSAQPRYATLGDRLLALPGMGAIFDMPRVMTPERTARLAESRSLQDAENRERIRRMQEEAGRDIGPSMF